jgi:hypothetical protein
MHRLRRNKCDFREVDCIFSLSSGKRKRKKYPENPVNPV